MLKSLLASIARRLSRIEQLRVDNQSLRERVVYLQEYSAALRSKKIDALEWLEITSKWIDPRKATFNADGMLVWGRPVYFLEDPKFQEAYQFAVSSGVPGRAATDPHIEWRVAVVCWAAWHAKQIDGDFVACGVNTGILSRAICRYVDFNATGKRFFLFGSAEDTTAQGNFAEFPKAQSIRWRIPDIPSTAGIDKISYLSIDLNLPSVDVLKYFWPKLASGAVVVFDNYGFGSDQRLSLDDCVAQWGLKIWLLPTGQGMLLKP